MRRSHVRRSVVGMMGALAVVLTACGDNGTGPGNTNAVEVADDLFDPEDIQVSPGATVTWTWVGSNSHNVLFVDPQITDSGAPKSSGTFSAVMPTSPGTYVYQCGVHTGMEGSVVVQ